MLKCSGLALSRRGWKDVDGHFAVALGWSLDSKWLTWTCRNRQTCGKTVKDVAILHTRQLDRVALVFVFNLGSLVQGFVQLVEQLGHRPGKLPDCRDSLFMRCIVPRLIGHGVHQGNEQELGCRNKKGFHCEFSFFDPVICDLSRFYAKSVPSCSDTLE